MADVIGTPPPSAAPAPGSPAQQGIPQFSESPVNALGFVLQQFGAGLAGQELPQHQLAREALARREMNLREIQVGSQLLQQSHRLIQNTPREKRDAVVKELTETMGQIMPRFGELIQGMQDLPDAGDVLQSVGEFADILEARCGDDVDCVLKWSNDKEFMGGLKERRDNENRPIVAQKMRLFNQGLASAPPSLQSALGRDAFGNTSINFSDIEVLNDSLPEGIKFSDSELGTMRRNPEILAAHGIVSPDLALKVQETRELEAAREPFRAAAARRSSDLRRLERRESAEENLKLEEKQQQNRLELERVRQSAEGEGVTQIAGGLERLTRAYEQLGGLGPRAVGLGGNAASVVGGLTGLLVGEEADQTITSLITGGDDTSGEVKRFQQNARKIIADSIPDFEAAFGRISEAERQIAERASGLLDNFTSKENVRQAILVGVEAQLLRWNHERLDANQGPIFDAANEQRMLSQVREMSAETGIPVHEVARMAGTVVSSTSQLMSMRDR